MGMTHYMELMMGSWYLLVLFMALPMFLAECYCLVSKIRLVNHRPPFNTLYSRLGGGMSLCHGSPNS